MCSHIVWMSLDVFSLSPRVDIATHILVWNNSSCPVVMVCDGIHNFTKPPVLSSSLPLSLSPLLPLSSPSPIVFHHWHMHNHHMGYPETRFLWSSVLSVLFKKSLFMDDLELMLFLPQPLQGWERSIGCYSVPCHVFLVRLLEALSYSL